MSYEGSRTKDSCHEDTRAALRMSLKYRNRIEELEKSEKYLSEALLRESGRTLKVIEMWGDIEKLTFPLIKRINDLKAALKPFAGEGICTQEDWDRAKAALENDDE